MKSQPSDTAALESAEIAQLVCGLEYVEKYNAVFGVIMILISGNLWQDWRHSVNGDEAAMVVAGSFEKPIANNQKSSPGSAGAAVEV